MVLVDTSVWVNYLHKGNSKLEYLLNEVEVVTHPFIVGELSCGGIKNRKEFINLMRSLSSIDAVSEEEYYHFLESNKLWGKGVGFVDVHLLAAAKVSRVKLWTEDKNLVAIAKNMKLLYS